MPKGKTNKKLNNITVRPMDPSYSDAVEKWRNSQKNASYLSSFYEIISILNTDENRVLDTKGKRYDYRLKAYHQHFTKKFAIFYRYVNTQLCVLAVMKHVNDSNLWRSQ